MVSRLIKSITVAGAAIALAGTAFAGGNGHHSTLKPLSTWSGTTGASYSLNGTSSRYSPSTAYTTSMSTVEADSTYGTGSISESYTTTETYGFSGATNSVAGLGYNESLQATSCPVNVYGTSSGSTVLGCYNVVKPVPQTTYYRVVRPVIYVRYPVAVPTCRTQCCEPIIRGGSSRYGGYGPQGGYSGYGHGHAYHHGGSVCR
ncbi:hypothetical protein [Litorimonas sp. WD9-15]|uniref:hypothetical protein n=1 Tax=Litorimonas sp. WD9-15 TaxID=3418716 RepID=UPI003CFCCF23